MSSSTQAATTSFQCPPGFIPLDSQYQSTISIPPNSTTTLKAKRLSNDEIVELNITWFDVQQYGYVRGEMAERDMAICRYIEKACLQQTTLIQSTKQVLKYRNEKNFQVVCSVVEYTNNLMTLEQYLSEKPNQRLEVNDFFNIACKMAVLLGHLHSASVLHLALTPSSFLIDVKSNTLLIRNFGSSIIVPLYDSFIPDSTGIAFKDLAYISPEQTGIVKQSVDFQTDIYSLGVIFYKLLAGRIPFDDEELLNSHANKNAPLMKEFDVVVAPALENIIQKMMCKTKSLRYKSATGILNDLKYCQKHLEKASASNFNPGGNDSPYRLIVPMTSAGREQIIQKVEKHMNTLIGKEQPILLLLRGEYGVGKSTIMNEVQVRFSDTLRFAKTSFYENDSSVPFSGLIRIVRELIRQILRDPMEVDELRESIISIIEGYEHLLLHQIPELQAFSNDITMNTVHDSSSMHFSDCIIRLIELFGNQDQKLVLYLDDVQNIDFNSLDVISHLVRGSSPIMIICASKENDKSHRFEVHVEKLRSRKEDESKIEQLDTEAPTEQDISNFVAQALGRSTEDTKPLSHVLFKISQGKMLVLKEALLDLYADSIISFNEEKSRWEWDLTKIEDWKKKFANTTIRDLTFSAATSSVQKMLKYTSVMNQFSCELIAALCNQTVDEVYEDLIQVINIGWVTMSEYEQNFKFSHTAFQHSASEKLSDKEKSQVHCKIAQIRNSLPDTLDNEFVTATHYNLGNNTVKENPDTIIKSVRINYAAATKALNMSAFQVADHYIGTLNLSLPKDAWETQQDLALDINLLNAQTQSALGNHKGALMILEELYIKVDQVLEKLKVAELIITCCNNSAELYSTGYKYLIKALQLLPETRIPSDDEATTQLTISKREVVKKQLQQLGSIDQIAGLPAMTSEEIKHILGIICSAIPILLLSPDVNTLHISLLGIMCGELGLRNGLCDYSSAAFAYFGWSWATFVEDTKQGSEIALIGPKVGEKYKSTYALAICNFFCAQISVWRNLPHSQILKRLDESLKLASRGTSVSLIALIGLHDSLFRLLSGSNMSEFLQRFLRLTTHVEKMKINFVADCASSMLPLIHFLKGENNLSPAKFHTPNFKEASYGGFLVPLFKAIHCYFTGQFNEAKRLLVTINSFNRDYLGYHIEYFYHMVSALIFSAFYHSSNNDDDKEEILAQLKEITVSSSHYNKKSKGFLAPIDFFVKAEYESCISSNEPLEAIRYFQQALKTATTAEFNLLQALCLNRLIDIYHRQSLGDEMISYLVNRALNVWGTIGSSLVADALRNKYGEYLNESVPLEDYSELSRKKANTVKSMHSPNLSAQANMSFLRRSSVASKPSSSTKYVNLKSELMSNMRTILSKSKADRCCLIMKNIAEQQLVFEAEISKSSPYPKNRQIPLGNCEHDFCTAIVRRVIDSSTEIVADIAHDQSYAYDRYVKSNNIRTMVCVPLLDEQELIGVMYLEDSSADVIGAHTASLISAIAEITIINTKANSTMKIATTTFEKFLPKDFLAQLGSSDAEMLESCVTKEYSLMRIDFQQLVSLVDKMPVQETFSFLNSFLGNIAPAITNNHGFIHQFLGDTLTALFPGAPDECLKAAVQIVTALKQIQTERKVFVNRKQPEIRIGIHYGDIKLGTVQLSETRVDTSFVSSSVQITKHLELFAKTLNTPIIVTQEVISRLVTLRDKEDSDIKYLSLGRFLMKDLGQTQELFHVYDKKWDAFLYSDERKKQFVKGLEMFQQRKFIMANSAFSKLHKLNDHDLICQYFGKVSKMYQQVSPPQNWDGFVMVDRDCKPNPIGNRSNSFYLQTGISAYHHFGDEQLLSNGKDKEEEIKLLNENLNAKSIALRDLKEILSVKEQEMQRMTEIAETYAREKKQEIERLRGMLDKERIRDDKKYSSDSGFFGKCFPCFAPPSRVTPVTENVDKKQFHPHSRRTSAGKRM